MTKELPSPDLLRKLLRYDEVAGKLYWLPRPLKMFPTKRAWSTWNARYSDKEAFICLRPDDYLQGSIFGEKLMAHRVIWAMVHNKWPTEQIDHMNGERTFNALHNLRDVSHKRNGQNKFLPSTNTSGHIGVYWESQLKKWRAQINTGKKVFKLGSFSLIDDAIAARKAAEAKHGFHPNHGKSR